MPGHLTAGRPSGRRMWTPRSPAWRRNGLRQSRMPCGEQWPHGPKSSCICRPEWHLFFFSSTRFYFVLLHKQGEIRHRKQVRFLVFETTLKPQAEVCTRGT